MTYQLEKLSEARESTQADRVHAYILSSPGLCIKQVARGMGLPEKSVCGRVGDLLPTGKVWYTDLVDGPKRLMATNDPGDMARNVGLYKRDMERKAVKSMRKAANVVYRHLSAPERATLRAMFTRLTNTI